MFVEPDIAGSTERAGIQLRVGQDRQGPAHVLSLQLLTSNAVSGDTCRPPHEFSFCVVFDCLDLIVSQTKMVADLMDDDMLHKGVQSDTGFDAFT